MSSALTSQRFCLRWNNHQSNLLTVFDQLLHDESFVDVTLAVEGRFLRAHKMVLSACSPYFQALFVGHPDKHPIVILKDVPYCDMRSLLDFMYRGEVSVDQERLTAFLKVAESLRIKGLTEVNEDRCDLPTITSSLLSSAIHSPSPPVPPPPPPHLHRIHPTGHKRPAPAASANPLLGSALTAPKRKRGRPRKLSGSSPGPGAPPNLLPAAPAPAAAALSGGGLLDAGGHQARGQPAALLDGNDLDSSRLRDGESIVVQGSPEMLEVKMGTLDFQQNSPPVPMGASTPASSGGGGSSRADTENGQASPSLAHGSSGKDLGTRRIKEEPEPAPGPSSQDPGQAFLQSSTDREQQAFALDSLGLQPKVQAISASGGGGGSTSSSSGAPPGPGGGGGGGGGGGEGSSKTSQSSSSAPSATSASQQAEGNELGGGGASSSSGTSGAGQPGAPAPASAPGPSPAASRQPPVKRRARRRATSASQDPAEALTEMSVRGLNLFRYASISEGVYKCTECAKVDVQKTFKNKYSFQRHAFLYHEGHQRKVFPCPVCAKEFSRPDKMKNHMKTVHDCFMPKDCGFPLGFFSFP